MTTVTRLVATGAVLAAVTAAALPSAAQAASAPKAGLAGPTILLQGNAEFSGYDIATDHSGTAYAAWIGDAGDNTLRQVHLCVLPLGATACQGGVQTTPSMGPSTAAGIKVLITPAGGVDLVWFYDKEPDAVNGPRGGRLALSTVTNGVLGAETDMADGPSHAELQDAEMAPDGNVWTVLLTSVAIDSLEVRPGFTAAPVTLPTPYGAVPARLAFDGSTAVLGIQKAGSISDPPSYALNSGGTWSAFRAVPSTWTSGAAIGLSASGSGVRLITSTDNASYHPVVSKLKGGTFTAPTLTGDKNSCAPSTHDTGTDGSGRLVDVAHECDQIAVSSLTDTTHAAIFRFPAGGTVAGGDPQVTSSARGHGWVAWGIENATADANNLLIAPILLPTYTRSVKTRSSAGSVTVTGPASCLTPVSTPVGVSATAAHHWTLHSRSLELSGRRVTAKALDGATLTPGKSYTLKATATFVQGTATRTVRSTLTFAACPLP